MYSGVEAKFPTQQCQHIHMKVPGSLPFTGVFALSTRYPKTSETHKPHKIKGAKTSETHIFFQIRGTKTSETHNFLSNQAPQDQ